MKYLGGRGTSNKCLNPQFFAKVFEHCNSSLSKSLIKPLLKYLLPGQKSGKKDEEGTAKLLESEASGMDSGDSGSPSKNKLTSRSNHQRLQAIEIFLQMIRVAQTTNKTLLSTLGDNIGLIT